MTIEQGAGQTVVEIRTSGYTLVQPFLTVGLFLVIAADHWTEGDQAGFTRLCLAGAGMMGVLSLWTLRGGVDLTPESASLRGVRRRSIPWREVQAVVRYEQFGSRTVRLILENGKSVLLRAPKSLWWLGTPAYERDFHHIGQWWLAHRGESWRPLRPEAPRPPVQG